MNRTILAVGLLAGTLMICVAPVDADSRAKQAVARNRTASVTQVVCISRSGLIRVRAQCRRNETRLNTKGLGGTSISGVPFGTTVTGVVGGTFTASTPGAWAAFSSFPGKNGTPLSSDKIIVASTAELLSACNPASNCLAPEEVASTALCAGTATAPTAPAGTLCIYPIGVTNATGIAASPIPATGTTQGFEVGWAAPAPGASSFVAVWAYTAPSTTAATPTPVATKTPGTSATPTRTVTPGATTSPTAQATATTLPTTSPTSGGACIDQNGDSSGCFALPAGTTGNVTRGQAVYSASCSGCHPSLGARTYSQVVNSLNVPAMQSLSSTLNTQQLADVTVYLNRNSTATK